MEQVNRAISLNVGSVVYIFLSTVICELIDHLDIGRNLSNTLNTGKVRV